MKWDTCLTVLSVEKEKQVPNTRRENSTQVFFLFWHFFWHPFRLGRVLAPLSSVDIKCVSGFQERKKKKIQNATVHWRRAGCILQKRVLRRIWCPNAMGEESKSSSGCGCSGGGGTVSGKVLGTRGRHPNIIATQKLITRTKKHAFPNTNSFKS